MHPAMCLSVKRVPALDLTFLNRLSGAHGDSIVDAKQMRASLTVTSGHAGGRGNRKTIAHRESEPSSGEA
jgi:hypothetical protein